MDDRPLPPGPAGSPITGNLTEYTEDPLGFLLRCAWEHGDVVRLSRGSFLVSHPELVRRVLHDKEGTFEKKDPVRHRNHSAFPASVMNSAGQDWQDKKRSLQPAFQPVVLGEALERSESALDAFIEAWRRTPPADHAALPHADNADTAATVHTGEPVAAASAIDVRQAMQRLCMDMGSAALLGMPLEDEETTRILQTTEAIMALTRSPVRLPAFLPTPANLRLRRARADLDASLEQIIARFRAAFPRPRCLLGTLLEHGAGTGACAWLRDELATMVMSGLEPMADALTWTLHLLSLHGDAQQRLADEVREPAVGIGRGVGTGAEPGFASAVVKESLRLYPPAWMTARIAVRDTTLGGFRVPAGTQVNVSPWVMHHDPRFFERPNAFLPQRWMDAAHDAALRQAYLPFGSGPRKCIGDQLALRQITGAVAAIVRVFRLSPQAGAEVRPYPALVLRPLGVRLFIEPRG